MRKIDLPLPGAFIVEPIVRRDARGSFVKTFHADTFASFGVRLQLAEEFYSISAKDVVRGMHFQRPPHDHSKIVCCPHGAVLDVLLDVRRSSPTFGQSVAVELTADNHHVLYIPSGLAHGFRSRVENSLMLYKTSTVHRPDSDDGVRWDSFGFDWGKETAVVSERDGALPVFSKFSSPFP